MIQYTIKDDIKFHLPYYIIGTWNFSTSNPSRVSVIAADTETKLYYKDKLLSEEAAYNLYRENGQAFIKQNIEVKAYCFSMSDGINTAIFQCCEDFLLACSILGVKYVIWYNAKFDFAIFDYYFLTNGWKEAEEVIDPKQYRKLPDKTYQSLHSAFGQRYCMRIWKSYIDRQSHKKVHNFRMIDLCNIVAGGLKKNLENWDIRDENNEPIRKLEMDYVEDTIENGIEYIVNDTKGLMRLAMKVNETMESLTTYNLFNGDYMTAGGLAKKTMLKCMYGGEYKDNIKQFQKEFPMSESLDRALRERNLYLGGKCLVNPYKRGIVQKHIYKYDVNSMYPDKQRNMIFPYGRYYIKHKYEHNDKLKIICVCNLLGDVKPDKIPIYKDFNDTEYNSNELEIIDEFLIWEEELLELENWYNLTYEIKYVLEFDGRPCENMKNFIDKFYTIKCNSKGTVKNGAKLILNSSYGKLAERIDRDYGDYELSVNGYVHFVRKGVKQDSKGLMSVIIGSRITALSRVALMKYTREICKENVKDNFIYCDTDSVHALTEYDKCDDTKLGEMKCEGVFKYGLYLAPKSYLMQDYNGEYCVHCKGVNTNVVENELKNVNFYNACDIFTANRNFKCLQGLNVKGGKALIYVDKMILDDKDYMCNRTAIDYDCEYEL